MKTLIYILGGQAVGKMTVGVELQKITNLKLFHNHMTVELANHFYGFTIDDGTLISKKLKEGFSDLRDKLRDVVLDNIGKSPLKGLIFTAAMYYDINDDWNVILEHTNTFKKAAHSIGEEVRVLIVELICDLDERLKRNESDFRLEKKPSKRNVVWTNNDILHQVSNHRVVLIKDEYKRFKADDFISIDNTNKSAIEVAKIIKDKFEI